MYTTSRISNYEHMHVAAFYLMSLKMSRAGAAAQTPHADRCAVARSRERHERSAETALGVTRRARRLHTRSLCGSLARHGLVEFIRRDKVVVAIVALLPVARHEGTLLLLCTTHVPLVATA